MVFIKLIWHFNLVNSAYNLFSYQDVPVFELSITGTNNSLPKSLFTVKDLITTATSPTSYCSGIFEFEATINSPQNVKFTAKSSSSSNSIFNANLGALFSINGGNGKRDRNVDGSKTTGSGGSSQSSYWSLVAFLDDPNFAPGSYVVGANGETYDLLGRLVTPSSNGYEIKTYGLTASFTGGTHQFSSYDIYWGDGTMETVSNSNYTGKVQSHRYTSPVFIKLNQNIGTKICLMMYIKILLTNLQSQSLVFLLMYHMQM